jgi:hypothetical protein
MTSIKGEVVILKGTVPHLQLSVHIVGVEERLLFTIVIIPKRNDTDTSYIPRL